MQLNACVYALAEKYQIDNLKALALEKFKENADIFNRAEMLAATWTVWKGIQLPETDSVLRDIVVHMWAVADADLFNDEEAGALLINFFEDIPEFAATIFWALAFGHKNGQIKLVCAKCKKVDSVPGKTAFFSVFKCKGCESLECEDVFTMYGHVRVEKFW